MYKILLNRNFSGILRHSRKLCKRFYLSEAIQCTESWENRLKAPVFQKLRLGNLYSELEKSFVSHHRISALDIDLFINGINSGNFQNELENLLMKLRENPETTMMYESTSHAAVRWYLAFNKKSDLFNILSQPLVFGVFLDSYLSILIIDRVLKESDVISAVKIAVLQMLQEDCNYPILRTLSLLSCIKYLNSSDVWETIKEVVDEEEEVVKVRVKFVRNEYFDDHFDIKDTNHLVGKTMLAYGKTIDDPIGKSCQLIGLLLYEKFDKARDFISHLLENNIYIHKEAVDKAKCYLENKPKQVKEESKENTENAEKDRAEMANEEGKLSCKKDVENMLRDLESKTLIPGNLEGEIEKCLKKEIDEYEKNLIEKQCQIYKNWEEERIRNVKLELEEGHKRSVMAEIQLIKEELEEEEQRLFHFDNEIDFENVILHNKERNAEIRYYKPKNKAAEYKEEIYIPPSVSGAKRQ